MRKLQFSIRSALIGVAVLAALFAFSLSYYQHYFGTGPIPVYPAENYSEPIIAIYRHVDYHGPYYGSYIQFAIWKDGKIVWRPEGDELEAVPLTSTIDPQVIAELFKTLSKQRLLDPAMRRNDVGTFHNFYGVQIATTNGSIHLTTSRDMEKASKYIDKLNSEMERGLHAPGMKTWLEPRKRFVTNWNIIQEFSRQLKSENGVPYDGTLPNGPYGSSVFLK